MNTLKEIVKFVLRLSLAIGLSVGLFYVLKYELSIIDLDGSFWEGLTTLFFGIVLLFNPINIILYMIFGVAWKTFYNCYLNSEENNESHHHDEPKTTYDQFDLGPDIYSEPRDYIN